MIERSRIKTVDDLISYIRSTLRAESLTCLKSDHARYSVHLHITVWLLKIDLTHPMSLCTGLAKREAEEAKIP